MSISFHTRSENGLLCVTASGCDESRDEVQAYGQAVVDAAVAHACTHVLCDERELIYKLANLDTYAAAKFIAAYAPKVARIAIVCHPACATDGFVWETVAISEGLCVRFFQSIDKASAWLALA